MATLNTPVYNQEGKKVGEQALTPAVFGVAIKQDVLHQAVIAQQANARVAVANTKTRGEVRGGGKKPWRQKGTGRARHGSTRSPIWVGGGITFGPRANRNFSQKLNRKVRNLALRMSLSDKANDSKLVVLDSITFGDYKTKKMASLLAAMPVKGKKFLLVLAARDEKVTVSARNIPGLMTTNAASLSVVDILNATVLLTTTAGIEKMEAILAPKTPVKPTKATKTVAKTTKKTV